MTRRAFAEVMAEARMNKTTGFLLRFLRRFRDHGIRATRVLTDTSTAFGDQPHLQPALHSKERRPRAPVIGGPKHWPAPLASLVQPIETTLRPQWPVRHDQREQPAETTQLTRVVAAMPQAGRRFAI